MDLRRLKTIFIFVLIVVNIAFMSVLYSIDSREKEIKEKMQADVSALLQKNLIYIDPKLDISTSPDANNFYLEKMSVNNRDMVSRFLGENYNEIEKGVYQRGAGRLSVSGDIFSYTNEKPETPSTDFSTGSVEKLCRNEMERLGVLSKLYSFNGVNYLAEDKIRAIFTAQYEKAVFFDSHILFDVTKNGIISVSGKNLISDLSFSGTSVPYYNVMSILPDLAENPVLDKNKKYTVVSIKHGYYIGGGTENYRNILAIPVWQIVTDLGDILYYDARNGNYINES